MRNWKEICAKCADGEIEPECEYYGEPNGCNSPTYQEHPHPDNAAARDEVVLRLSKEEYKGMQEALSEHDRLCEMLTESRMSIGNAAAMREALVKIRDKCVIYNNDLAEEIDALCGNALSAPARNCDKYATADEALKAQQAAFEESNFENGECKLGCPGCDDFPIKCEVRWLFAPAKEGGEA